jgi:beta-mannosidase
MNIPLNGSNWQFKGFVGEDWLWRNAHKPDSRDVRGWKTGTIPGSVQNDLWQAGMLPDPYAGMNSLAIEWVPERTWLYKRTFSADPTLRGKRVDLVFEGVDYSARFYLNGELLGQHTGMFLPAVFPVGDRLNYEGENLLVVVIDPAPFEQPQIGYTSRVYTQKTRMNYWWDFCPRMVHVGIWQDVYLRVSGSVRFEDVHVQAGLSVDLLRAEVDVHVRLDEPVDIDTRLEALLRHAGEEEIVQESELSLASGQKEGTVTFRLDQPELWWPNGAGEQPLYEVEVTAFVANEPSNSKQVTFGIRRVEFEANEGAAAGTLPYNLVVNGRKIYIQGWNWVPMDVLYGVELPDKRERLLRLAKKANVNLLRVWGGGLIEKEAFYQLCDQSGILIWQEFIQSSSGINNFPSEDPSFIQFLVQNAEQAILARRNHPALAVWSGGNELHYDSEHLCDDSTPALAALHDAVQRLDPGRYWVPTSPAGGVFAFGIPKSEQEAQRMEDVHGPWEYQGLRKQYELYNNGVSLLHSEFGVEGLTNLRALNRTIPTEQQWPVSLNNPVWEHLGSWWVKETVWQEAFGGSLKDLTTLQRATQFLQADGLRYAVEAERRRMFHNGGTMPWQFNEPYPMAACTSAVDYFAEPKPVYYAVGRAYQPLSITARFDTLAWGGESEFSAEIWSSNSGAALTGDLAVQVMGLDGRNLYDKTLRVNCADNQSQAQLTVTLLPELVQGDLFLLDLALWGESGDLLATNRYLFSRTDTLAPMVEGLPAARVKARVEKNGKNWLVMVENTSDQAALWLWLEAEKPDLRAPGYAYFEDNYFCLLPGEQRTVRVRWSGIPDMARMIRCTGWNFGAISIR